MPTFNDKYVTKVLTWAINVHQQSPVRRAIIGHTPGYVWYVSAYMCAAVPESGWTITHGDAKTDFNIARILAYDAHKPLHDTNRLELTAPRKGEKSKSLHIYADESGTEYRVREDFLKLFAALDRAYLTGDGTGEKVFVHAEDTGDTLVGAVCCVRR